MSNRYIGGVVTETTNVDQSPWSGSWTEQAAMQSFGSVLRITNSLRFRSSASAYLNRTSSAGNQTTWTWSGWVKKGLMGVVNGYLFSAYSDSNNFSGLRFGATLGGGTPSSDGLNAVFVSGGADTARVDTTQVFRDPSAWYHIVYALDTTQATASNRVKLYVNGVQITAFATASYPSQNSTWYVNSSGKALGIGAIPTLGQNFDGYMAEVNFVDGQALPPTAFGAINKENGVWAPITYTGTYGLNGFRLTFNNTTSTTTLGYDSSGNGNNWTTNNISLTAGSTYDSMIDSPSKFPGASYGVGNYAVLNPLNKGANSTLNSANLNFRASSSAGVVYQAQITGTFSVTSGKWYWEVIPTDSAISGILVGIAQSTRSMSSNPYGAGAGTSYTYIESTGHKYDGATDTAYGASYTNSDVIGVAFDADAGTLTFYKNNTSQGTAFTGISGSYMPYLVNYASNEDTTGNFNFGQRPFAYTPPTGYKTLCTQNLPNPTIFNGAQYMAATLYTGNGTSQTIVNTVNGVSFQPDLVWEKSRSNAYSHKLFDSVRGVYKELASDSTAAESTDTNQLTSFNSNGWSVGLGLGSNGSGSTFVGWQWKAGGTAVTNTAGSITSSVSANTTAGFSVVTYTGNGTNPGATIGHGLGVTPSMIITKSRNTTGEWPSYHVEIGVTNTLYINATYAATTYVNRFSAVSSTTFTTGSSGSELNTNGTTYVAYCFAAIPGYSAFGSFTGNGSNDGAFIFLGFRPKWVMFKSATQAYRWYMLDSSRNAYNVMNGRLFANSSDAEQTNSDILDFVSNGVKIRTSDAEINGSGQTIIYACFAENPFQNALAR